MGHRREAPRKTLRLLEEQGWAAPAREPDDRPISFVDHYVLDLIMALMRQHPESRAIRGPRSIEFVCPATDRRYEILIREVDGPPITGTRKEP
jgi:hypothetical protein